MLGVRLRAGSFEGYLLLLGKTGMTSDDLLLAEAVAGMVAARLDSVYLTRSLAENAATEERIRLARDLHDGVLQSLTGVGLRLEGVRRLIEEDVGEAAERLFITEGTVKIHFHNIYQKLKVTGRLELALYARDKGLA